ncbi:TM2 domain-containing protein [Pseudorhodobacter sp.]|uniref:TM2 domain-containing protein n=1 Tax=Pseudorhodobacter sp. TaxID=1934400 RepID=UPI002AFE4653|nr:TM2 domain-containing protein [Pseudorhodobacter sp.]
MEQRDFPNAPQSAVSNDAVAMMRFQSNSKSTGTAYLLWFFLGGLGGHRFYLGSTGIGVLMLVCTVLGAFLLFPLIVTGVVAIYDLFTIPSQVQRFNNGLMADISVGKGS